MANVSKSTVWRDADGNLTTDESKGLFLVAREGSEITPEMQRDYPELKGSESKGDEGDSTLSEAEAATVEANASRVHARNQKELAAGEGLGDPEELEKKARAAALKAQTDLAASIGGTEPSENAKSGTKKTAPSENK